MPKNGVYIEPPLVLRRTLISLFHGLALATTVLRLVHRHHIRRLWWDDLWAFFAVLCSVMTFLVFWVPIWAHIRIDGNSPVPISSFILLGTLVFYVAGLWCARISVAVVLVRLLGAGKFRSTAKTVVAFFGLGATALIILRVFKCGVKFDKPPICPTPLHIAYLELILDLLGDTWLVAAPLVMLSTHFRTLASKHRRLIAYIFCCGVFTTVASVVHITFMTTAQGVMMGLTAHIQLGISIIVCNLLVLATYVYRKYQPPEEIHTVVPPVIPTLNTTQCDTVTSSTQSKTPLSPTTSDTPDSTSSGGQKTDVTHLSLTELGSSMLGGSSRGMSPSEPWTSGSESSGGSSGELLPSRSPGHEPQIRFEPSSPSNTSNSS